jgi:ribosome-associated toxin RatA of RatAB toxin-antitoxin module
MYKYWFDIMDGGLSCGQYYYSISSWRSNQELMSLSQDFCPESFLYNTPLHVSAAFKISPFFFLVMTFIMTLILFRNMSIYLQIDFRRKNVIMSDVMRTIFNEILMYILLIRCYIQIMVK